MFSPVDALTERGLRDQAIHRGVADRVDDAARTVGALVEACGSLIERDGVLDFNMRELLDRAKVSNRAFYRHFPTKEALIATLADDVYTTMISSLDEAVAPEGPAEERLAAWIDGALHFAREPSLAARGRVFVAYEARLRAEHPELYRHAGRRLASQVSAIIDQGRDEGRFTAPATRAALVVRLVVATIQHHVLDRTSPTPAQRDELVAFVIGACR